MTTTSTTSPAAAAEYLATEVAWNGSATDRWIADRLARGGHGDVDAAAVTAFAVEAGLLSPIPRIGGYTVTKRVNARTFGRRFAEWVAA